MGLIVNVIAIIFSFFQTFRTLLVEKPYFCTKFIQKTMVTNKTFTMLKPDSVEKGNIGGIVEKITASGFRIVAMKLTQLTEADAEAFYAVHSERPFYGELVTYMTRGPIVAC